MAPTRLLDPATEPARVRAISARSDWTAVISVVNPRACEAAAKWEGFQTLSLMATLPGVHYENYGFQELARSDLMMPDGVTITCEAMEKLIA